MEEDIIIKPRVELDLYWGSEELIAAMTDVIYRGYSSKSALDRVRASPELVERRIKNFLRDGHYSVFEFMGASWIIEGSRAMTHELVRHRMASYWQESQRYVDYRKGQLRFVVPRKSPELLKQVKSSSVLYLRAREAMKPEDARYVLPNLVASRIWVQMNAREALINFIPLRTGLGAFHEIRVVAWLVFNSLLNVFPITAKWVWDNLPALHPDYCRNAEELSRKYFTNDCRALSVTDAFSAWEMEVPAPLRALVDEVLNR